MEPGLQDLHTGRSSYQQAASTDQGADVHATEANLRVVPLQHCTLSLEGAQQLTDLGHLCAQAMLTLMSLSGEEGQPASKQHWHSALVRTWAGFCLAGVLHDRVQRSGRASSACTSGCNAGPACVPDHTAALCGDTEGDLDFF